MSAVGGTDIDFPERNPNCRQTTGAADCAEERTKISASAFRLLQTSPQQLWYSASTSPDVLLPVKERKRTAVTWAGNQQRKQKCPIELVQNIDKGEIDSAMMILLRHDSIIYNSDQVICACISVLSLSLCSLNH